MLLKFYIVLYFNMKFCWHDRAGTIMMAEAKTKAGAKAKAKVKAKAGRVHEMSKSAQCKINRGPA